MAWVAVAGLGISAGAKVFSAVKAGKAAKANQKILDGQMAEAKTDANKSFLDTSAAKDAMKVEKENLVDERKNVAGRGVITGASDEAIAAGNSNATKNHNATVSRLAGMGTQYQERAKGRVNNLAGMQMGINQQKADSAANLSDAAGDLASTAAMGIGGATRSNPYKGDPGTVGKTGNFEQLAPRSSKLDVPKPDMTLKKK